MRFRRPGSALAALQAIEGDAFPALLKFSGVSEPERFSVVQIVETSMPDTGHKLRTRISRLADPQWAKVVKRSLAALDDEESGWPVSVGLIAGEPFDHRDAADDLPPNFPESSLKGVAPGPARIATMMLPGDPSTVVTITLDGPAPHVSGVESLWPLAVTALSPIAENPDFEVAAVRPASSGSDEPFDPDPAGGPVILVCGPAATEQRRADLTASADTTFGESPLLGLHFELR